MIDTTGTALAGDFDGNGTKEIVVSSPEADCGKGAIYVIQTAPGSVTTWTRDTAGILGVAACNDLFGQSLAVADLNADGRDDLVIGVPGAADAGPASSGVIAVIYGSATGLTATGDQVWHQDSTGILGVAEAGDYFGDALETGDFNCDGYADIAVGVPRESIEPVVGAGAVHVFYGSVTGVSNLDDLWYQGNSGVNDATETADRFGAALASGNFNGDVSASRECDDLAIGAPDEDIGTLNSAGLVYIIDGSTTGLETVGDQTLNQNITGVAETAEANDFFGFRLGVTRIDGDAYDDLFVDVPGDMCGSGAGVGRQTFYGSAGGVATVGNTIECDTFACSRLDGTMLGCHAGAAPVHGLVAADTIGMFVGNDVVWGYAGNDIVRGDYGNDIIFGGADNDTLDGGPGRDVLSGGAGNDSFTIDAGCEVMPGEVIDGGAGTDTVRSSLSQSALLSLGITMISVESFVLITGDPMGPNSCDDFPVDGGPFVRPPVELTWTSLPNPSSTMTTTTGVVPVQLKNNSTTAVTIVMEFGLRVRGEGVPLTAPAITLAANAITTYNLDLNDFIPFGINPSLIPPELLVLPTSASIMLHAGLVINGKPFGESIGPTIYGHLQGGTTAVLYREAVLDSVYHDGDLAAWRAGRPDDSGPGRRLGTIEVNGSLGIPGY